MSIDTPYSQDAEEALLGALLINPSIFEAVTATLKADDFYFLRHSYIYQAMQRVTDEGLALDNLTVCASLEQMGWLADVGGPAYLTHLIANTPTSQHAPVYAELVRRAAVRRNLMTIADDIKLLAVDGTKTVDEVLYDVESNLNTLADMHSRQDVTLSEQVDDYEAYIEDRWRLAADGQQYPYATGFINLAPIVPSFERGEYVIIGGRPGSGKTSLMLCIMRNLAERGAVVRMMSLEMSVLSLIHRMVSQRTRINGNDIKGGKVSVEDKARLTAEYERIRRMDNLSLAEPKTTLNIDAITADIRQAAHDGCEVYFIDYINLIAGSKRQTEYEVAMAASNRFKQLARELNIVIVAGAQLNRDVEKRQDKRPVSSDLRQAGEQDADIIMLLYRDVMYNEFTEYPNEAQVIVSKNRNGATGTCSLYYDYECTLFLDGTRVKRSFADEPPRDTAVAEPHWASEKF